jgi:hypothetical protein
MGNLIFYILAGFGFIAILFLLMIAGQLFKIEKALADLAVLVEHRVKKMYERK